MESEAGARTVALLTYAEAARVLRVDVPVIRALVKRCGVSPKPVPWNGRGKGLDLADLRLLQRAWRRTKLTA
jgi:hypothetical protein